MSLLLLVPLGVASGVLGTVTGAASLLSFPALLALGYSPLTANVTNTVGGSLIGVGATFGFRREIKPQRELVLELSAIGAVGGVLGALLLLWLGNDVFKTVAPVLLVAASALVVTRPVLLRRMASSHEKRGHRSLTAASTFLAAVYGGYFGAALGVVLVGVFGVLLGGGMQRSISLKAVVAMTINLSAVAIFIFCAPVAWGAAAVLGASSIAGGYLGAHTARRLSDRFLITATACIGIASAIYVSLS